MYAAISYLAGRVQVASLGDLELMIRDVLKRRDELTEARVRAEEDCRQFVLHCNTTTHDRVRVSSNQIKYIYTPHISKLLRGVYNLKTINVKINIRKITIIYTTRQRLKA